MPSGAPHRLENPATAAPLADAEPRAEAVFPLVYRMMHALAGPSRELDDLVQAANEQVLRSMASFEGRARFSTWVYRVCYLTLLKESRWHRRWLRRFTLTDHGELPEAGGGVGESAGATSAADMVLCREREQRLRAAIDRLSPKRRAALVMRELEGMEVDEIAAIVGANALTVRSRIRDARRELAVMLANDPYFGDRACSGSATDTEEETP